jgi:hypothetical protein
MWWRCAAAVVLVFWSGLALANAGLPMLMVAWPLSIAALVPVVVIESWVIRRNIGLPWRASLWQMSKANVVSTLVGIPLTWVVLVAIEFGLGYIVTASGISTSYPPLVLGEVGGVVLASPWLGPFREGGHWIVPVATASLLVPFFFVSAWTESWMVNRSLNSSDYPSVRQAVWRANLVSYVLLFVGCMGWLAYGLMTKSAGLA